LLRRSLQGRANLARHRAALPRWRGERLQGRSSAGSAEQRSRRVCKTAGPHGTQGFDEPLLPRCPVVGFDYANDYVFSRSLQYAKHLRVRSARIVVE
jgi:hypothetical protein